MLFCRFPDCPLYFSLIGLHENLQYVVSGFFHCIRIVEPIIQFSFLHSGLSPSCHLAFFYPMTPRLQIVQLYAAENRAASSAASLSGYMHIPIFSFCIPLNCYHEFNPASNNIIIPYAPLFVKKFIHSKNMLFLTFIDT